MQNISLLDNLREGIAVAAEQIKDAKANTEHITGLQNSLSEIGFEKRKEFSVYEKKIRYRSVV